MRNGILRSAVVLGTLASGTAAPGPGAQQEPPPRFRESVTVERLVVDIRVVDDSGEAVVGLEPADFEVKVDGKAVAVESAVWVGPSEDPGLIVTPEGTEEPPAGASLPEPRLVVFLFQKDMESTRIGGLMRMMEKLDRLLAALAPGDLAAGLVFDTHLRLVYDFSTDRGRLRRAFERDLFHGPVAIQESDEPSLLAHFDPEEGKRAASPEKALELIGEALQPLPGAKTLVFVGWGMGRMEGGIVNLAPDYDRALWLLQKARCSVFSLDVTDADFHSLEVGLQAVAEDTGGFYARTHLFPDDALRRVERALQGYYVLSFERPEGTSGPLRLEVDLDKGKKGEVLAPSAIG